MTREDLARVMYEGYCEHTGWKSAVSGDPLPQFGGQRPEVKSAWYAAADAVMREAELILR